MKTPLVFLGSFLLAGSTAWAQAVIPLTNGSGSTPQAGELEPVPGTDGAITSLNAATADQIFITGLTGTAEIPPRQTDASGAVAVSLNPDGTSLHYRLSVSDIQDVTAAHLHIGLPDENGPIVVPLLGQGAPGDNTTLPEGVADGVIAEGDITITELTGPLTGTPLLVLMELLRSGAIYANVHTSQNPEGEIRGQMRGIGPNLDSLQLLEGMPGVTDGTGGGTDTGTSTGNGTANGTAGGATGAGTDTSAGTSPTAASPNPPAS